MKTIDSIAYVIFPVPLLYRSLDREKKKNLSFVEVKIFTHCAISMLDFYVMNEVDGKSFRNT